MTARREWLERDYYQTLGVSSTATDHEITHGYRTLAKRYHPDAHAGSEDRFKEISSAYYVLGDSIRRKEYDDARWLTAMAGRLSGRGAGGVGAFGRSTSRAEDPGNRYDPYSWGSTQRARAQQWWADEETVPSRYRVRRRRRRYMKLMAGVLMAALPLGLAAYLGMQNGLFMFWTVMETMFFGLLIGAVRIGGPSELKRRW